MPRWFYALAADIMVVVHLAFMMYIILGELLIVVGMFARWAWVRNPWFRWTHLAAIMIVVAETFVGMSCPLTEWEYDLRELAGQVNKDREASFTGRIARQVLFIGNALPEGSVALTASYFVFGGLVLGTFLLAPPRRRRSLPSGAAQYEPIVVEKGTRQESTVQVGAGPPGR